MASVRRFLKKETNASFFLFGPRGTGKSFWICKMYPDAKYIDLLDSEEFQKYFLHPERLIELKEGNPNIQKFIIDEIQKAPRLLDSIHLLIERHKDAQFILTGSSARKLRNQGVNLLGGRGLLCKMHPYMATELGEKFDFNKALGIGTIPLIWHSSDAKKQLYSYIHLYLREEVQLEGLTRNLLHFNRFLEAVSFSHAAVLNISNVAQECGVNRKTVEGYLGILEDLMLGYRIEVFTKKAKRLLSQHPKFYFFDTGVFRTLRPIGPLDKDSEIDGPALEGLVEQHLRAWCDYSRGNHKLHFWRTRGGLEVDFIVYGENGLYALEVKNSDRIRTDDLEALNAFSEDYPIAQLYLLYRGKETLKKGNILCVPCEKFLRALVPDSWPFKS